MEGYKRLASFTLGTVIQDLTIEFIKRWIPIKSRTYDQMEQAARSGKQNIAEAANMLLTFCQMETFLIKRQIDALTEKFVKEGGFRENLFKKRMSYKNS